MIHSGDALALTQLVLGAYYRKIESRYIQIEPDNMREDEISLVIEQFVAAAIRADKAGFDGVQIHAAHFFFLSRFISQLLIIEAINLVALHKTELKFCLKF